MDEPTLSPRLYASLPPDDPRFAELRAFLSSIKRTGKSSPTARMLGEWALLGFLLTTGQIALGSQNSAAITLPEGVPDPQEVRAAQQQIADAVAQLGGFDE
jgi:hypothetical protein